MQDLKKNGMSASAVLTVQLQECDDESDLFLTLHTPQTAWGETKHMSDRRG